MEFVQSWPISEFNPRRKQLHKIIEKQKDLADKGKSVTTSQPCQSQVKWMSNTKFEEETFKFI